MTLPNTLFVYKNSEFIDVTGLIQGPKGDIGFGLFTIRAVGPLTEKTNYDNEDPGFSFLAVDTHQLYIRWGTTGSWGGPYDFPGLNSSGMDDWEKFPGFTLETKFDYPTVGTITEILKLTLNNVVFATRTTTENIDGSLTSIINCPSLSINRQSIMIEDNNIITETITNIEE